MMRRRPIPTRPDTLFPGTTLLRSPGDVGEGGEGGGSEGGAGGHGDALNRSSPKAKPLPFTGGAVRFASLLASRSGEGVRRYRPLPRSEEHTSELQSLMRISYAVLCLQKKNPHRIEQHNKRRT